MAEEGTLGQARASLGRDDNGGVEPSKEELQRRMEEARESITQTVTEIKETVTNQYYSVRETVSDALDWRHHFRQRPITFSVGALSVGFLVGYGLAGAFKGDGGDESDDYPSYEESDVYARTGAKPYRAEGDYDEEEYRSLSQSSVYAGSSSQEAGQSASDDNLAGVVSDSAPREEQEQGEQKPGLLERFKGTSAYDRLQTEVASLGDRFIDELSRTAQTVVLPALFNKIKEMFGVDLSHKQGQQQAQGGETKQAGTGAQSASAQAAGASASSASASSGSSYGTSENRGYGSQSSQRVSGSSGSGTDSVLDLDR